MAFGSGFGANAFGATSSGFGNSSQPLFGQTSNPFGQSTPSFGTFGQSTGQSALAFAQSTPQFGQSTTAFGQSAPAFGGQSASPFVNFATSQPSLWGQSSAAFGASQTLGSSQPFGAAQSAFGTGQQALGAQSQALFGSSQPMFSQSQPLGSQSQFGSGWGNQNQQAQQPPSTRSVKYQISHLYDTNSTDPSKFMAISAMDQFRLYSIEELRFADYARREKSAGTPAGISSFDTGFNATGNTGFGTQSGGAFVNSAFSSQPQPGFGTQSQSLFGGQSQAGLFGGASSGTGGASSSSGGLFGSTQNQAQGGMAAGGGGSVFGNTGFGSAGFGQPSTAASGFGAFGSAPQSQSLFAGGNQQSSGGLFGGTAQSNAGLFGSHPHNGGGLFGSQTQSGAGLFGSQQSGGGPCSAQSAGGLFGGQSQTGSAPFGASLSAPGGTTGTAGLFAGQQGAHSAPSLFGASAGSGLGNTGMGATGGLFGGPAGNTLLGNTGGGVFGASASYGAFASSRSGLFGAGTDSSLFGNQPGGASSSNSLFGAGFAGGFGSVFGTHNGSSLQQQQQQQQGPLEATLTKDPYGQSHLFSSTTKQLEGPSNTLSNQPTTGVASESRLAGKDIRVVVESKGEASRRMPGVEAIARQEVMLRASGGDGRNTWPVRYWGPRRSLFDKKSEYNDSSRMPAVKWRNDEQKRKAISIRKLVIQAVDGDPILKAASGQGFLHGKGPVRLPSNERQAFNRASNADTRAEALEKDLRNKSGRRLPFSLRTTGHESEGIRPSEADETDADVETSVESELAQDNRTKNLERAQGNGTEASTNPALNSAAENQTYPASRGNIPSSSEIERFNSRYVPCKSYYNMQMRKTGQGTELHADEQRHGRVIQTNSNSALQTNPSISALEKMSTSELSRVESFKVWKPTIGEIVWQEPVDLRGVNLDQMIRIEPKEVCVYPREEDLPAKGEGLNKPAVIRLHGIWKKDKETGQPSTDASTVASIVRKLKARCEEDRLEFLGYEITTGTWTFRAQSF